MKFKNIIFKNNNNITIFSYNNNKKIKLNFNENQLHYDLEINALKINLKKPSLILKKSVNLLNKILFGFEDYFFKKIKFKGKGFRLKIKKKKKAIKFSFGHSHLNMLFLKSIKLKKSGKYKFVIKNSFLEQLNKISKKICLIKPTNVFTNRGIRQHRQIIFKRKGKKSSYM